VRSRKAFIRASFPSVGAERRIIAFVSSAYVGDGGGEGKTDMG